MSPPREIKRKKEKGRTRKAIRNAILNIHWGIWSVLIAASLNFILALAFGNIVNLLACLACLVGLFGIFQIID
jgi:hypothetical protein